TTHLAARMEQLAAPGTVRLTANTLRLAEGYIAVKLLGPMPVKGLPHPVEVYELTGAAELRGRLQAARARGLATSSVGKTRSSRCRARSSRRSRDKARSSRSWASRGWESRAYLRVRALPSHGWLACRRGKLSLLRQGDALSAID